MPNFRGTFNWHCEIVIIYRHATGEKAAKRLMIIELAKRLGRTVASVRRYFSRGKDNFKIELVND